MTLLPSLPPTSLVACALNLALLGCTADPRDDDSNGGTDTVDASIGGGGPDARPIGTAADAGPDVGESDADITSCIEPVENVFGNHRAGRACFDCHSFTLAGTLYTNANGDGRVGGATIRVVDATGKVVLIPTADTEGVGNFYTYAALTFPVTVDASKCPTEPVSMSSSVSDGNCNKGGCHGPDNSRIFLPQ